MPEAKENINVLENAQLIQELRNKNKGSFIGSELKWVIENERFKNRSNV